MANSFDTSFLFLSFSYSGRPRLDKSLVQISLTWKWKWSSVEKLMKKSAHSLPALHLAGLLSLSVNREISLFLPTLFPVSSEDKPTQKIFALETFTALCKMSFVLPLSNSLAGRNSFCSYTPACPGSSIYPTLCECLSYKSDIISIDLNDGLCPTSHFKGVVSLSPAENLCGRSC